METTKSMPTVKMVKKIPGLPSNIKKILLFHAKTQETFRLYKRAVEQTDDSIFITDIKGVIEFVNPAFERLTGFSKNEVIGKTPRIIKSGRYDKKIYQVVWNTILSGKPYRAVFINKKKNGEFFYVDHSITALRDQKGNITHFVAVWKDITDRMKAEEERRRLATIVEFSNDAIFSKDINGIIESWNKAAEKMYGYTKTEIIGKHVNILFPRDRKDEFNFIMDQMKKGESVIHYETLRQKKDSILLTVSVSISPVRNTSGKIIGASSIARDISEKKHIEEELRRSKQQLEMILSNLVDGITVQDPQGGIIYANQAAAGMAGYNSWNEMLQNPAAWLDWFEIRDEFKKPMSLSDLPNRKIAKGEESSQKLINYVNKKTGEEKWSIVKSRRVVDNDNKTALIVTIIDDVTERIELERRKDEFISIASHELKTPVTSLKVFTQILERLFKKNGEEKVLRYLFRMNQQIDVLTNLIGDLLDVSKIQSGKLQLRRDWFFLDQVIKETVETIQESADAHKIVMKNIRRKKVYGDLDRIAQVLTNLLTNAIKYSPGKKKVIVSQKITKDKVVVSVKDYGIGILKSHQRKIFERFYRVYEDKDKTFPGLGMGLYISSKIIARHSGNMWVESTQGKGATFYFSLPITKKS